MDRVRRTLVIAGLMAVVLSTQGAAWAAPRSGQRTGEAANPRQVPVCNGIETDLPTALRKNYAHAFNNALEHADDLGEVGAAAGGLAATQDGAPDGELDLRAFVGGTLGWGTGVVAGTLGGWVAGAATGPCGLGHGSRQSSLPGSTWSQPFAPAPAGERQAWGLDSTQWQSSLPSSPRARPSVPAPAQSWSSATGPSWLQSSVPGLTLGW